MSKKLPGGRGVRYGQDSGVSYLESIDERVQRLPETGSWIFSNLELSSGSVACTADRLILYPCKILERQLVPYESRISVDIAVAASTMRAAIYVFRGRMDGFFRLPFTSVLFDCSSVGQQSCRIYGDVVLEIGARYFVGTCSSSAAVSFIGSVTANDFMLCPAYIEHAASVDLPTTIGTDDIIKAATESVPIVSYVSREASEVM